MALSLEQEKRRQNKKSIPVTKPKSIIFANTTPRIKKRDADVSDSDISIKTTKTAKTKIAPTDKSTSRLFLVIDNSCIPLTDAAINTLDPATRSKVWVQHGNEAPILLFP